MSKLGRIIRQELKGSLEEKNQILAILTAREVSIHLFSCSEVVCFVQQDTQQKAMEETELLYILFLLKQYYANLGRGF